MSEILGQKREKTQKRGAKKAPEEVYNGAFSSRKAQICGLFMIGKAIGA
jgi:hypothetical protein